MSLTLVVALAIALLILALVAWLCVRSPRARALVLRILEAVEVNKERIVTLLTPILFAPLAAAAAVLAGKYFPGVDLPTDKLVGLAVTGFLGAVAAAITWLRGTQKERDNHAAVKVATLQSTSRASGVADAASAIAVTAAAPEAKEPSAGEGKVGSSSSANFTAPSSTA